MLMKLTRSNFCYSVLKRPRIRRGSEWFQWGVDSGYTQTGSQLIQFPARSYYRPDVNDYLFVKITKINEKLSFKAFFIYLYVKDGWEMIGNRLWLTWTSKGWICLRVLQRDPLL